MNKVYVPIIKCKLGEQKALAKLDEEIKTNVKPLIEIPRSQAMTKKDVKDVIESFWNGREFFFYFMPDWYVDYDDFNEFIVDFIVPLSHHMNAVPVIDLSLLNAIDDWSVFNRSGLAIRLRNNEFGAIEDLLNTIFDEEKIERGKVDLIFDLQYVSSEDLFAKTSVLKAAFSDLDKANEFNSIIISSNSFPQHLSQMESKRIYRFKRNETEIFALALKLANRFNFNYIYSDYGPTDVSENVFVVGMSPNFKIKYTAFDDYIYIKGIQIKRGGLDIGNVRSLAKQLIKCSDYSGEEYSWGDRCIYDIAEGGSSNSGNLTSWVSYAMNHHITFIVKQI